MPIAKYAGGDACGPSMELFQPNNLSRQRPEFTRIDNAEIRSEIGSLLKDSYGVAELDEFEVAGFVGANISSHNFKVSNPSATWFLKSRDLAQQQSMLDEANLTLALFEGGQRVPHIVLDRDGSPVSLQREKCWVLYEFQDGDYFTGKGVELDSAAKCFGALSRAASELPRFARPVVSPDEFAFLDTLEELLADEVLSNANDVEFGQLCLHHRKKIIDTLGRVRDAKVNHGSDSLPLHLDFHPLNLLVNDEEVICILDLEHLKTYPVVAGVGFAGYKLIRQAMVDESFRRDELENHTAAERWSGGWQLSFPESHLSAVELGLGAQFRILKVIHLILDATLKRGDHRFNYDMRKQIDSLYESDVIFMSGRDSVPAPA